MNNFPAICVDNFFKNPNAVRQLALSLDYSDNDSKYPGVRTQELGEVAPDFFKAFVGKLFSLFVDVNNDLTNLKLSARFQKIPRLHTNDYLNRGWIHDDGFTILAGVVYLNPEPNIECGTSLYKLKDGQEFDSELVRDAKTSLYKLQNVDEEKAQQIYKLHNDKFIETVKFGNVYNRLVAYDASIYHKANSFEMNEDRLTLVFFLQEYSAKYTPFSKMNEFDI